MHTLQDATITARKQHTCYLCHHPIPKGLKYRRIKVVDSGVFWSDAEHNECSNWYMLRLHSIHFPYRPEPELWSHEAFMDEIANDPTDAPKHLTGQRST